MRRVYESVQDCISDLIISFHFDTDNCEDNRVDFSVSLSSMISNIISLAVVSKACSPKLSRISTALFWSFCSSLR